MIYFRYVIGGLVALLGTLALTANSYLLGSGAARWAHEHDPFERAALATGGAIVPWLLAVVPMLFGVIVATGWLARQGQRGIILLLWAIFFFYNFTMGGSNLLKMREDTVAVADQSKDTLDRDKDRRASLRTQLSGIPSHRPPEVVEPLLEAQRNQRPWSSSEGCKDVTRTASRKFCDGYKALESELAAGKAAEKLTGEIEALDGKIASVPATATAKADPFVAKISEATGWEESTARTFVSMLTPFILEVVGASCWKYAAILFGLTLRADGHKHGVGAELPPPLLYSPEAINRQPSTSLEGLTRARSLCKWFFRECAKPAPGGSMPEVEWFEMYADICKRHNDVPLPLESFRRIASSVGAGDTRLIIQDIDGVKHYQGYLPLVPVQPAMT